MTATQAPRSTGLKSQDLKARDRRVTRLTQRGVNILAGEYSPRPVRADDYWKLKALHEPQISQDGRLAVYFVEQAQKSHDRYRRAIHVRELASSRTGILENAGENPRALTLSPDGTRVAWVAGGADASGIRVARLDDILAHADGEAPSEAGDNPRLFEHKALGSVLHWLPDGQSLVAARVQVHDAPDGIRVYTSPRFKADGSGLVDPMTTEVWQVSVDGAFQRRILSRAGAIASSALSPDGRRFAFTAAHADETSVFIQDLFVADVDTGDTRLVFGGRGMTLFPSFAPDSARLVFLASRDDLVADGTVAVWEVELAGGPARELAPHLDRPAMGQGSDLRSAMSGSGPVYASGGTRVRFLATDRGASRLYEVDPASGELAIVTPEGQRAVGQYAVAHDGSVVFVGSDSTTPDELYWLDPSGREHALTALNQELKASWEIRAVEPFAFTGADGWTIEGFLQRPPSAGEGPYPLVLDIHGGPRGSYGCGFKFDIQAMAAQGVAVLYVNPRGSDAYGKEFANAVINDWGHKDYEDLMAAVDAAVERGIADPERLGVTGYSYGGFMSTWVIGHTGRFKAAAPGGCVTNLVSFHGTSDIGWYWGPLQHAAVVWEDMPHLWAMSPLAYVQHVSTKTLLYHAEGDDRCPIGQTEEFYAALRARGQDATFVRYPRESHVGLWLGDTPSLRVDVVRRLGDWFGRQL